LGDRNLERWPAWHSANHPSRQHGVDRSCVYKVVIVNIGSTTGM
jgi:hypothetical protein